MKTIVTQPVDSITNQQKGSHLRNGYRGLSALEEIMIFLTVNIPASPLIVQNGKLAIVIQIFEVIHSS